MCFFASLLSTRPTLLWLGSTRTPVRKSLAFAGMTCAYGNTEARMLNSTSATPTLTFGPSHLPLLAKFLVHPTSS